MSHYKYPLMKQVTTDHLEVAIFKYGGRFLLYIVHNDTVENTEQPTYAFVRQNKDLNQYIGQSDTIVIYSEYEKASAAFDRQIGGH